MGQTTARPDCELHNGSTHAREMVTVSGGSVIWWMSGDLGAVPGSVTLRQPVFPSARWAIILEYLLTSVKHFEISGCCINAQRQGTLWALGTNSKAPINASCAQSGCVI